MVCMVTKITAKAMTAECNSRDKIFIQLVELSFINLLLF